VIYIHRPMILTVGEPDLGPRRARWSAPRLPARARGYQAGIDTGSSLKKTRHKLSPAPEAIGGDYYDERNKVFHLLRANWFTSNVLVPHFMSTTSALFN